MAHSAAFNEARRLAYREGRLLGLSPRDAGHLYGPKFVERAASRLVEAETVREGTAQQRQEAYARKLSALKGREVTPDESRYRYRVHNYAKTYTKTTIIIEDSDGNRRRKEITLTSDEPLTRAQARQQIEAYVEKGNIGPFMTGTDRGTLVGVEFDRIILYPEINY